MPLGRCLVCTNRVRSCKDESAQLCHTIEHHCQPEEVQEAGGVDANTPLVVGDHPGQDLRGGRGGEGRCILCQCRCPGLTEVNPRTTGDAYWKTAILPFDL